MLELGREPVCLGVGAQGDHSLLGFNDDSKYNCLVSFSPAKMGYTPRNTTVIIRVVPSWFDPRERRVGVVQRTHFLLICYAWYSALLFF